MNASNKLSLTDSLLTRYLSAATSPLVGSNGLEPSTSRLSGVRSNHLSYEPVFAATSDILKHHRRGIKPGIALHSIDDRVQALPAGGDGGSRTHDLLLARQALSQLSYTPVLAGLPPPSFESPFQGLQN